jgi:hypothetical protein
LFQQKSAEGASPSTQPCTGQKARGSESFDVLSRFQSMFWLISLNAIVCLIIRNIHLISNLSICQYTVHPIMHTIDIYKPQIINLLIGSSVRLLNERTTPVSHRGYCFELHLFTHKERNGWIAWYCKVSNVWTFLLGFVLQVAKSHPRLYI